MTIRPAELRDRPAIRDVARRSLQSSYSLGPREITSAIDDWYGHKSLEKEITDDTYLLLVAIRDAQVVGFAESHRSDEGSTATLLWLHVDPDNRGEGIATALFEETEERLAAEGVNHLDGRVLKDNAEGRSFFKALDYERAGQSEVEIGGSTHVETVWTPPDAPGLESVDVDDETVFVNYDESDSGSTGDFFAVYSDRDLTVKYGYYCGNCETLATAMDAMGRVECACGNTRKPTRWDAAYM
jgi:ribosomal protein S18 acetylase RimI-like enzyme